MGVLCEAVDTLPPVDVVVDAGARGLRTPRYSPYKDGGGFGLCTESLGSESSCDGSSGDEEEMWARAVEEEEKSRQPEPKRWYRKEDEEDEEEEGCRKRREFPPPLPSLMRSYGGSGSTRSRSCMKAVRKDGRLILTEVVVERPEVLRASRENGRLRLQLVRWDNVVEEEEEGLQAESIEHAEEDVDPEDEPIKEEDDGDEEKEEEEVGRWRRALEKGEGGFRRCQEVAGRGHGVRVDGDRFPLFWNNPRFMTTA